MGRRGPKSAAEILAIAQNRRTNAHRRRLNPPEPPDHLTPETQQWWASIAPSLEPHQWRTLTAASEAWDLKETARRVLAQVGLSFVDSKGMIRARPEAAIARDSRAAFLRCLHELKLDVEPPKPRQNGGIGVPWEDIDR
jgi:phage terminase small subunit